MKNIAFLKAEIRATTFIRRMGRMIIIPGLLLIGACSSLDTGIEPSRVAILVDPGNESIWHGNPYPQPFPAPPIELDSTGGSHFSLEALRGRPILLYFGYTHCPDICPATLADVRWTLDQLGDISQRPAVVFITVDPSRDTLESLNQYLEHFGPEFVGLHGDDEQLNAVYQAYGIYVEKEPGDDPDNYMVSHTARLFLIDPQGSILTNYSFGTARQEILQDLQTLLED